MNKLKLNKMEKIKMKIKMKKRMNQRPQSPKKLLKIKMKKIKKIEANWSYGF